MDIQNRTVLISGGASGLGAATARMLVNAEANVVIADVNKAAADELVAELGGSARFVETDVVDEEQVQAAIDLACSSFGELHGLVNCAGIAIAERVLGREGIHNLGRFAKVVAVNLTGTFNCVRLAAAAMAENSATGEGERGVIVNTASIAAYEGQIGQVAYAASKGGVAAMTLPLAREFARNGIRVMAIAPGPFDTALLRGLPDRVRQEMGEQVPFPSRLGRPGEYAVLVKQIFQNPYLNGEVIRLDGAIRMGPR